MRALRKAKHKKCNKLIKVESDKFREKIEKICNEKDDHGLRIKIGGDFSKLLLLKAHYHKNVMRHMSNLLNWTQSFKVSAASD